MKGFFKCNINTSCVSILLQIFDLWCCVICVFCLSLSKTVIFDLFIFSSS